MSISFYDASVGTYLQVLGGMAGVLEKGSVHAAENGIDLQDLIVTRLAEDMLPLNFQVVSTAHYSWAAIQAMQKAEVEALASGSTVFKMEEREIALTNQNFLLSLSLPNFYFHATIAYDILRMKGVPVGKLDFLAEMKMGSYTIATCTK